MMIPMIKVGPPQMYPAKALVFIPHIMPMTPIAMPPKPPTVLTIDLKRFIIVPMLPLEFYFLYGKFSLHYDNTFVIVYP